MAPVGSLQEAHFCSLASQSNVYGLTKFYTQSGVHKLLVASLRGRVICVNFEKTRPLSREVHFTYIPGGAEIVSIDAFNKAAHGGGVVVGITFIKKVEDPRTHEEKMYQYLNIYSEPEAGAEYDLDRIAQGCQNLELDFKPYKLHHTEVLVAGVTEAVFLLSGSDNKVHLYREDKQLHRFMEHPSEDYFPEFAGLTSCVTWMNHVSVEDKHRLTASGCLDGIVRITLVDTISIEVLQQWTVQHDSPVTSMHIFSLPTSVTCPAFLDPVIETGEEAPVPEQRELNLLVTGALDLAVIYRNVLEKGLQDPLLLPQSDRCDSTLCSCVADIDFDGENEILLGTYGQELLCYKFQEKTKPIRASGDQSHNKSAVCADTSDPPVSSAANEDKMSPKSTNQCSEDDQASANKVEASPEVTNQSGSVCNTSYGPEPSPNDSHNSSTLSCRSNCSDGEFTLLWKKSFADPILALLEVDITGDGLNEIIVVSLRGLHVLQQNVEDVSQLVLQRLKELSNQPNQPEDIFNQLLQENLS